MENKKPLPIYIKYLISLGLFLLLSFVILWTVYKLEFNKSNVSDSLFISNIIIFLISIGINIGAGNIFNPLKYTAKKIFTRNKTNDIPISYSDYLEDKELKNENYKDQPWYITYASGTLLIIAFILIF